MQKRTYSGATWVRSLLVFKLTLKTGNSRSNFAYEEVASYLGVMRKAAWLCWERGGEYRYILI
ncbi:MAG: hypothetical protein NT077_01495 [Candidatus Taylorbacteria bacterium]|nr:hypothetical protein [Candidatus Taylorbacteria bacterium]